jgi:hypothetical protein
LDETDLDELWLFAVDAGDRCPTAKVSHVARQRGGGMLTTRDHQDRGSSLCTRGGVGLVHFFHSRQPEPDEYHHVRDDQNTKEISWPTHHSRNNGDYQHIIAVKPVHELLKSNGNNSRLLEYFPAHPHEGTIGVRNDEEHANVIATGTSQITGRPFNLIVAFGRARDRHGNMLGRAIAESSFYHFVDYNSDTSKGCPSFLLESPGYQINVKVKN